MRPVYHIYRKGNRYEPTVLLNAKPATTAVREEIFGPVLPVVWAADYEEALTIANSRRDGLSAYLWTRNPSVYADVIQRLETVTIFLNSGINGYLQDYHNGHKPSWSWMVKTEPMGLKWRYLQNQIISLLRRLLLPILLTRRLLLRGACTLLLWCQWIWVY